ncbi:MAG TPA: hypothetical protein VFD43_07860, partial [Planctomycetota bacterium]|nr:hypothetical protein [Planctomycetota bacterium]
RFADALGVADTGAGSAPVVDLGAIEFPSAWVGLGHALVGVTGEPVLLGTGTLLAGSPGTLALSQAAPGAPALMLLSPSGNPTPFKCGQLVPVPVIFQLPLVTNGAGAIPLLWASWPAGLSGLDLHFQWAIADGAAVCGVALSNALRAEVP